MAAAARRLSWVVVAALIGYGFCWVAVGVRHVIPKMNDYSFLAEEVPLPHHVPEHPGGVSFRFAMAADVIHQRFPKHGLAHYRERDRLTRLKLASLAPDDPARFPLSDDLAAGLERLGKSAEAVEVMRDKLARQQKQGLSGRDLYTSFANLGTFLIHESFPKALAGDSEAKARFREGVGLIRQSVEVNPEAHFGRERWQAGIAEFLLASMDDPSLLGKFDCLGNRLDAGIEDLLNREGNWISTGYGRATNAAFSQGKAVDQVPSFFQPGIDHEDPKIRPQVSPIREFITKVGAEDGWEKVAVPSHRVPVPFDEPVLGIVGMWRQGGGANPHFNLALGETMLRVGQRYIAWAAFERASRMADRFWPDQTIRQSLRDHCRRRQSQIEATITYVPPEPPRNTPWQYVSPPLDPSVATDLRADFDKELSLGEGYQQAYQAYEEAKIQAGVPITEEHFFDDFQASHPSIATPPGPEEWFVAVPRPKISAYVATRQPAWGIFGAGVAAMVVALLISLRSSWKTRNPSPEIVL